MLAQVGPDRCVMKADNRIVAFVSDVNGRVIRIDVTYPGDATVYAAPRL